MCLLPRQRCKDGKNIVFAGLEAKFWKLFCELIQKSEWGDISLDNLILQPEIKAELEQFFSTKTRDEWVAFFGDYDLCISPVLSLEETLSDPHLTERKVFRFHEGSEIPHGWNLGVRKIE